MSNGFFSSSVFRWGAGIIVALWLFSACTSSEPTRTTGRSAPGQGSAAEPYRQEQQRNQMFNDFLKRDQQTFDSFSRSQRGW